MKCHRRATCHIAWCCHLANSMSWSQSYVSHCRVLPPGEFNGMSSQSHVSHCMVLPLGEFTVMIPETYATLQGAATGRIQRHVIPEPRITLHGAATWWIHCHDSGDICHIAGCSHLTWQNQYHDRDTLQGVIIPVWALTSSGFRIVSDTLVWQYTCLLVWNGS